MFYLSSKIHLNILFVNTNVLQLITIIIHSEVIMNYLALIITTVILTSSKFHIVHRNSPRCIITDFQRQILTEEWGQKVFSFVWIWAKLMKVHEKKFTAHISATIKYWYQTIIDTKSIIFTLYFKDIESYRTTS